MKRLLIPILLAGCAETPLRLPDVSADTCNAAAYASLIGQDATALEKVLLLGKVRVIRPGQPVTMDYWQDRINFMIDANNSIDAITCG